MIYRGTRDNAHMPSHFGARTRQAREALGWTLADLNYAAHEPAQSLGTSFAEGEIGRIERGDVQNPGLAKVAAIARALGTTIDYLITGDGGEVAPAGAPNRRMFRSS